MSAPFFQTARADFHAALLKSVLSIDDKGKPSNSDKSNPFSVQVAHGIASILQAETRDRHAAQTSGRRFEDAVASYVRTSFDKLQHLRPGDWSAKVVKARSKVEIAKYAQYAHLLSLSKAAKENPEIAAALGNDYAITPDIVLIRGLEPDANINASEALVDEHVSERADLRAAERKSPLLHASISTKWTLRSDRAQNARSEALNLIRNRKGRQPHIVVVVGEPLPSRLSSLALGTGDLDCVYHFALNELISVIDGLGNSEAKDLLTMMVEGKRLKDISDLPLDLAV